MGVPARHHSRSRVGKRRSHMALRPLKLNHCPHCKRAAFPHCLCPHCGYYKDKEIIDVYKGLSKKERKAKEKKLKV